MIFQISYTLPLLILFFPPKLLRPVPLSRKWFFWLENKWKLKICRNVSSRIAQSKIILQLCDERMSSLCDHHFLGLKSSWLCGLKLNWVQKCERFFLLFFFSVSLVAEGNPEVPYLCDICITMQNKPLLID